MQCFAIRVNFREICCVHGTRADVFICNDPTSKCELFTPYLASGGQVDY